MLKEIILQRATLANIDDILAIEKSLDGLKTYSALTNRGDIIKEITNSFFYVIKQGDKMVGDISYEIKGENHAYISGLAILPQFQGKGIARRAVAMILEEL